jgi:hypothetical protein
MQLSQEIRGRQAGLPHRHGVEEAWLLVGHVHGISLDDGGDSKVREKVMQPLEGPLEMSTPIAKVRTQSDGNERHGNLRTFELSNFRTSDPFSRQAT